MAGNFDISIRPEPNLEQVAKQFGLTEHETNLIGRDAINRTLATGKTAISKRLRQEINLRKRDVDDQIKITKANIASLEGRFSLKREHIPLMDFIGTKETDGGVRVMVSQSRGWKFLRHAFIEKMPNPLDPENRHVGVFQRLDHLATKGPNVGKLNKHGKPAFKLNKSGFAERFAIGESFGLTLVGYLAHAPGVLDEVSAGLGDILNKNISSQLERRLAAKGF